ncbi:MAG TPA: hypothetical protein VHT53_04075, partial [Candidatus Elarobacter sp.]|nr:hypothetical protein [Candidatus Elarobacter sp.]
ERDPFTAGYGELVRRFRTDETEQRRAAALVAFESFDGWVAKRRVEIGNAQLLDADGAVARARSSSYLPKSGPRADELEAAIRALVAQHARDGRVTMALHTIVIAADVGAG